MNTNIDYIRAFFGEKGDADVLFTDDELKQILKAHTIHLVDEALQEKLARAKVDYRLVDDSGLMRIRMKELKTSEPGYVEFYAGVGNWLDGSGKVFVNELEHILVQGEGIDFLHGLLKLASPLPEGATVEVETYLIDMKGVLLELLRVLRASRAKLALKAQLAGLSLDLSRCYRQIEKEIEVLSGSYELNISNQEEYPH